MSSPDPAKIEKYPEGLREEWTGEATVSAWRKWQAPLAAFTREATQALLQAAQLRPGMRVRDIASSLYDGSAISMPFEIVVGTGIRA